MGYCSSILRGTFYNMDKPQKHSKWKSQFQKATYYIHGMKCLELANYRDTKRDACLPWGAGGDPQGMAHNRYWVLF